MRRPLPLLALASALTACLDFPPRVLPADAGADAGPVEDAEPPPVDAGPSACVECIMTPEDPGPGCGTAWNNCKDQPRCVGLVECADEARCFRISDLPQFLNCTQPCVEKFMLMGTSDPVYPLVTPIVLCTTGSGACVPICRGN
jgi:hypothetical protein